MYSSLNIAASMIVWCNKRNIPIQNGKMNDLLYLLNDAFNTEFGYQCIADAFELWQGPISRKVYNRYKMYGDTSISCPRDYKAVMSEEEWSIYHKIMHQYASKSELELNEIAKNVYNEKAKQ